MVIEDRIIDCLERYNAAFAYPPKLLILPFTDYLELQDYADDISQDFSYGKRYLGMIVTFDYGVEEIVIKAVR